MKLKLFSALLLALLLGACSNNDEYTGNDVNEGVTVRFQSDISNIATEGNTNLRTSSNGTQWQSGDGIGVFMTNNGISGINNNVVGGANNKQYKANSNAISSSFIPSDNNQAIFYPQSGNVDFIAYYPYVPNIINYTYPVDIKNQSNPAALDVLYSNNATGYNKNSGTVALGFKHKLSCIVFNLRSAGSGIPQSDFDNMLSSDVSLSGFPVEATIDLEDGTVRPSSDRSQTFNPLKADSPPSGYTQFTAIIVPDLAIGHKVVFNFTNLIRSYTYNINIPMTNFASGQQYTFSLQFIPRGRNLAAKSSDNEISELQVTEIKQEVWR